MSALLGRICRVAISMHSIIERLFVGLTSLMCPLSRYSFVEVCQGRVVFMYVRWDDSPPVRFYWDISDNLAYISPGIRADSFITLLDESGFVRIWINVAGLDEEQIARFNVTNFGVATKWCGDWLATPDER